MSDVVVAGLGHEGEVGEHAPANLHPLEAVGGQHGGHHVLREPILMQPRSLQQKPSNYFLFLHLIIFMINFPWNDLCKSINIILLIFTI